MAIEYKRNRIVLRDVVGVDDAEGLLGWLQKKKGVTLDLTACTHLHPAPLQVLLAGRVTVAAWPTDEGLAPWLKTIFQTQEAGGSV